MQLENLDVAGKRVLVRVDFNVPTDGKGNVTDDTRIRAALPTIQFLLNKGASVILMSHFGRPKASADGTFDKVKYGLGQVVPTLSALLGKPAYFAEDCIGEIAQKAVAALQTGDVLLLENTRFYKEEEKGDADFAKQLAALGDVYVNDAFGAAHRSHASTCVIANQFGAASKAFGFLMGKELESANRLLHSPARPFTAIIGGAKVSDKIMLLDSLVEKVDNLLIGGGMAYTLLKAQGAQVGKSLVEADKLDIARQLLDKAQARGVKIYLPEDSLVADAFSNDANRQTADSTAIADDLMGLDIAEKARATFAQVVLESKSIFWNGPMGVFEMPNFAQGTFTIADAVAEATQRGAFSLVGGGDSVAALHQSGKSDQVSFVSTGGGAMLELIESGTLPGVEAIKA